MKKYLHIICDAGLANRIHAMFGAMIIARRLGRQLVVHWPVNDECGAKFKQLFGIENEKGLVWPEIVWADRHTRADLLSTRATVRVFNCGRHDEPYCSEEWRYVEDSNHEHIVIKSWCMPHFKDMTPMDFCELKMSTQAEIKKLYPLPAIAPLLKFRPRIGMHIRYGDRIPNTNEFDKKTMHYYGLSPLEQFVKAMKIVSEYDVEFYISSPSNAVITALEDQAGQLGMKCTSLVKPHDCRNTVPGMREAVADLWHLGDCNLVLGSYWSQFSELAVELVGEYRNSPELLLIGTRGWEADLKKAMSGIAFVQQKHWHQETMGEPWPKDSSPDSRRREMTGEWTAEPKKEPNAP